MTAAAATLAERVEGAMFANPYFSTRHLRFETEGSRVTLSGSVSSYFQKQMAQEIVRRIDGVAAIDNLLEVSWAGHSMMARPLAIDECAVSA
jgi:osmotically-inducible protein OsmY